MKSEAIRITIIPIEGIVKKGAEALLPLFGEENKQENHAKNPRQTLPKMLTRAMVSSQLSTTSFSLEETVSFVYRLQMCFTGQCKFRSQPSGVPDCNLAGTINRKRGAFVNIMIDISPI